MIFTIQMTGAQAARLRSGQKKKTNPKTRLFLFNRKNEKLFRFLKSSVVFHYRQTVIFAFIIDTVLHFAFDAELCAFCRNAVFRNDPDRTRSVADFVCAAANICKRHVYAVAVLNDSRDGNFFIRIF